MIIRHDFLCSVCKSIQEFNVNTRKEDQPYWRRCKCGEMMTVTFTVPVGGDAPATTKYFSGGVMDYGAGRVFNSRREQEKWMKSRGLSLADDMSLEEYQELNEKEPEIKVKDEDIVEAMHRGKAKLDQGWRPKTQEELDNIAKEIQ